MSLSGGQLGLGSLGQRNAALTAQQQAYLQQAMAQQQAAATSTTSYYSSTTSQTIGQLLLIGSGTGSTSTTSGTFTSSAVNICNQLISAPHGPISIHDGHACQIKLPDGTLLDVRADGSFSIHDHDAKIIYRAARMRDFNPFINASDKIEAFIAFCGAQGVRKDELLELPLRLFIGWLILEAAKADREPAPDVKLLPDLRKRVSPQCPGCGRFTLRDMRARRIEFCSPACFERHFNRNMLGQ